MAGWIKLHRDIQDHWIWKHKPFSEGQAWIDLLLLVNHEDKKTMFDMKLIEVKRGSRIISIRELCERWKWSNTKVTNFLKLLKTDGMIDYFSDKKKTVITILNYSIYQERDDNKTAQERHSNDTETSLKHTNKNDKNDKNEKNDIEESKDSSCQPSLPPYEKIMSLFHEICKSLPRVKEMTPKRKDTVRTWWKTGVTLDDFKELFTLTEQSDFLTGRNGRWTGCNFDWIVKPVNRQKILEGTYNNKGQQSQNRGGYTYNYDDGGDSL